MFTVRYSQSDVTASTTYATYAGDINMVSCLTNANLLVTARHSYSSSELNKVRNTINAAGQRSQAVIWRILWGSSSPFNLGLVFYDRVSDDPNPQYSGAYTSPDSRDPLLATVYEECLSECARPLLMEICNCGNTASYGNGHQRNVHVHQIPASLGGLNGTEMIQNYGPAGDTINHASLYSFEQTAFGATAPYSDQQRAQSVASTWQQGVDMHWQHLGDLVRCSYAIGALFLRWTEVNTMSVALRPRYDSGWLGCMITNGESEYSSSGSDGAYRNALAVAYNNGTPGQSCWIAAQTATIGRQPWVGQAMSYVAGIEHFLTGYMSDTIFSPAYPGDSHRPLAASYGPIEYIELAPEALSAAAQSLTPIGGWPNSGSYALIDYYSRAGSGSVMARTRSFTPWPVASPPLPATMAGIIVGSTAV